MDWLGRQQRAMAAPEGTDQERVWKYAELRAVGEEFLATASLCAITIVADRMLPVRTCCFLDCTYARIESPFDSE